MKLDSTSITLKEPPSDPLTMPAGMPKLRQDEQRSQKEVQKGLGRTSEQSDTLLSYDELDRKCRSENKGLSLYEYCAQNPALRSAAPTEDAFRAKFAQYIPFVRAVTPAQLALYAAFAEEASFTPIPNDPRDALSIPSYSGMNVPNQLVADMCNELLSTASVDKNGMIHGKGVITIDKGSERNGTKVTIDFDKKTIDPPLFIKTAAGMDEIKTDDIQKFFNNYLAPLGGKEPLIVNRNGKFEVNPTTGTPQGLGVFSMADSSPVIRHEIMHAFYDNDKDFRNATLRQAAKLTPEQRECAVLFTACNYDVFDPDTPRVSRDIVLDEALNAYADGRAYDAAECTAKRASIGDFVRRNNLTLNLDRYSSIDSLPLSAERRQQIHRLHEDLFGSLTEVQFLKQHCERVLDQINDMRFLRTLLKDQSPQYFAKVEAARKALVDDIISEASL